MIRFYKSYLGRLLLGFLILIELERATDKSTVVDQVRKWKPPTPETGQLVELLLDNYVNAYPDDSPSNDDVVKGAFGQLQKRKNEDSDLLDLIVNALKLPFTSNFGANGLKALRDAVLTPSELGDLRRQYRLIAKCSCGHEFMNNEMVSATIASDAITLRCTKCARPQFGRCDHCGTQVSLIGKVAANWRNDIDCGCRKKAERAGKQPAIDPLQSAAATTSAAFRQLIRSQGIYSSGGGGKRIAVPSPALSGGYIDYVANIAPAADDDDGGF